MSRMQSHTMATQAEVDSKHRYFKRDVNYRSVRATTTKAFSTFRKKVSELQSSATLRRRPLRPLNEDSPRATPGRRRLPPAPVKRRPESPGRRSPELTGSDNAGLFATPGPMDSSVSEFGDSPALFSYKAASPGLRRALPDRMRRSVRNLMPRKGLMAESTPPSAKRLVHKRRSKNLAKRRIQEIQSPRKRTAAGPESPGRLAAEVNELAEGLASLDALAASITHGRP